MSQYTPIFQVEVGHEYFEPVGFAEPRLVPTPATATFLSRRGFRWVSEGATHTLYADSRLLSSAGGSHAWLSSAPATLCFGFETSWPGFGWATPLPGTTLDSILIYTAALTPKDKAPIQAQGPVVTALGTRVVPKSDPELPVLNEPTLGFHKPLLVLVVTGVAGKMEALVRRPGSMATVRLRFPSRATTWRYHLFDHGRADQNYQIEPASGKDGGEWSAWPRFRPAPGIHGPGGEVSLSFESEPDRPIPLRWRPRERFRLVGKDGVLMQPLPLPGPVLSRGSVKTVHCSEMIVHL